MVKARPPLAIAAIAAALGLVLAAAVLGLWVWSPGPQALGNGPLAYDGVATGSGFVKDAGEAVSVAGIDIVNPGRDPIVLERVTLVDPDDGVRLLGGLAGQRTTASKIEAAPGFPPRQPDELPASVLALPDLAPLEGYVVPPQLGVEPDDRQPTQLFIGLASARERGKVTLQSFRVDYRVDGTVAGVAPDRYSLLVPYAVAICTPRAEYTGIRPCGAFLPKDG